MAEELVRLPVDVIVADRPAVLFAQAATQTISIIGAVSRDRLSRPLRYHECPFIVSSFGTASTIMLGWRAERRQSQEFRLKIEQLELQLVEARAGAVAIWVGI
jgi:hypothetical protein